MHGRCSCQLNLFSLFYQPNSVKHVLLWVQERAAKEAKAGGGKAAGAAAGGGGAAGGGDDDLGSTPRRHKRPPVWQLITSNMYTFRERKEQDEDDIMICQVGAGRSHVLLHPTSGTAGCTHAACLCMLCGMCRQTLHCSCMQGGHAAMIIRAGRHGS